MRPIRPTITSLIHHSGRPCGILCFRLLSTTGTVVIRCPPECDPGSQHRRLTAGLAQGEVAVGVGGVNRRLAGAPRQQARE